MLSFFTLNFRIPDEQIDEENIMRIQEKLRTLVGGINAIDGASSAVTVMFSYQYDGFAARVAVNFRGLADDFRAIGRFRSRFLCEIADDFPDAFQRIWSRFPADLYANAYYHSDFELFNPYRAVTNKLVGINNPDRNSRFWRRRILFLHADDTKPSFEREICQPCNLWDMAYIGERRPKYFDSECPMRGCEELPLSQELQDIRRDFLAAIPDKDKLFRYYEDKGEIPFRSHFTDPLTAGDAYGMLPYLNMVPDGYTIDPEGSYINYTGLFDLHYYDWNPDNYCADELNDSFFGGYQSIQNFNDLNFYAENPRMLTTEGKTTPYGLSEGDRSLEVLSLDTRSNFVTVIEGSAYAGVNVNLTSDLRQHICGFTSENIHALQTVHAMLRTPHSEPDCPAYIGQNLVYVYRVKEDENETAESAIARLETALELSKAHMLIINYDAEAERLQLTDEPEFIQKIKDFSGLEKIIFFAARSADGSAHDSFIGRLTRKLTEKNIPHMVDHYSRKSLSKEECPTDSLLFRDANPLWYNVLIKDAHMSEEEAEGTARSFFTGSRNENMNRLISLIKNPGKKAALINMGENFDYSDPEYDTKTFDKDWGQFMLDDPLLSLQKDVRNWVRKYKHRSENDSEKRESKEKKSRNLLITGNKGSGKMMYAKMLMYMFMNGEKPTKVDLKIVSAASAFKDKYVGGGNTLINDFFSRIEDNRDKKKTFIIFTGIENIFLERGMNSDNGEVLSNLVEAVKSRADFPVIFLCDQGCLRKVLEQVPGLKDVVDEIITLRDYEGAELKNMLKAGLDISKRPLYDPAKDEENAKYIPAVRAAFSKLTSDYSEGKDYGSQYLRFNMTSSVIFKDVLGNKEAKNELKEIAAHITDPYYNVPKGVLFSGPPGTGKTLLAKAFAGEARIPFCSVPTSFLYSPANVSLMFREARKRGRCVIFIDEIESVVPRRNNIEPNPVLTQFLQEMDGFSGSSGCIILAATNHPVLIDEAMMRDGRFDRKIMFELPNKDERKELFRLYATKAVGKKTEAEQEAEQDMSDDNSCSKVFERELNRYTEFISGAKLGVESRGVNVGFLLENGDFVEKIIKELMNRAGFVDMGVDPEEEKKKNTVPDTRLTLGADINDDFYEQLAKRTSGQNGATIENIVKMACNIAMVASGRSGVLTRDIFTEALNKKLRGGFSNIDLSDSDRMCTAYHEVGHAIAMRFIPDPTKKEETNADTEIFISVRPRKNGSLGVTIRNMDEGYHSVTRAWYEREIAICLAGRVAEEIFMNGAENVSSGCSSDMAAATAYAYEAIASCGLYEETGLIVVDMNRCSNETKYAVEKKANEIMREQKARVKELLTEKLPGLLGMVAGALFKEREIDNDRFEKLISEYEKSRK